MQITVTDQNGQPLGAVWVVVEQNGRQVAAARTTPAGTAMFSPVAPGNYSLKVQAQHYYTATLNQVVIAFGQSLPIEVKLQPVREFKEEVEVTAQPSPIDPEQTAHSESISAGDIATIPYPTTRDYRNVMAFIPGVIADNGGQIHPAGASAQQVGDYLDGFEVSQPAGGGLGLRLNPDTLRKIDVRSTRFSPRFGKGSGGLADLEVQDGDNLLRYNATDFIPTFQNVKGFSLNNWTPRAYISGPVLKERLWFSLSHEGEYDNNIVKELPDGADTNTVWRTADMVRLRFNASPGNVITASALANVLDSGHAGISPLDPYSVSFKQDSTLYLVSLKDQLTLAKKTLLEFGAAYHTTHNTTIPQGDAAYVFTPQSRTGNFYLTNDSISDRSQAFSNLFLSPFKFFGSHQFTVGGEVDRIIFAGESTRGPIQFVDQPGNLIRELAFDNRPHFSLSTLETSAYAQDRWSMLNRATIEVGGRWDRDGYTGQDMFSPRVAGSVMLAKGTETKLSAGVGVYYDRSNLSIASQAQQGARTDTYLSPRQLVIPASFTVNPSILEMPRFVNWSAGIETRLPWKIYGRLEYLSRHGNHVWAYEAQPDGSFLLQTDKHDDYDGALLTLRRELKPGYPFVISYLRSRAVSNQSISFSLDNFTTGNQLP